MVRKLFKYGLFALVIIFVLGALGKKETPSENTDDVVLPPPIPVSATTRPFHMGFTRWPPDFDAGAITLMYDVIKEHGDLIAHHFDDGVPWQEAYENASFNKKVEEDISFSRSKTPKGHRVYVAITPLDTARANLAAYRGENGTMPLPGSWAEYALDDIHVKTAYLNYARRMITEYQPEYLAIGIEVNALLTNDKAKWDKYKNLHAYIYTELKKLYPSLYIFASLSLEHLEGRANGSESALQKKEIRELLRYSDLVALSAYPYGWAYSGGALKPVPDTFWDSALQFDKPIAIAESGYPSHDFKAFGKEYSFTEDHQRQYMETLLRVASKKKFVFIVNWVGVDSDKLAARFPQGAVQDFANFFAYDGIVRSDGALKKSATVWDAYLKLPVQ